MHQDSLDQVHTSMTHTDPHSPSAIGLLLCVKPGKPPAAGGGELSQLLAFRLFTKNMIMANTKMPPKKQPIAIPAAPPLLTPPLLPEEELLLGAGAEGPVVGEGVVVGPPPTSPCVLRVSCRISQFDAVSRAHAHHVLAFYSGSCTEQQ